MLKVRGLTSGYGDLLVVRDVDLDLNRGEFVGIIGSNAAGKSTLMRALVGLLPRHAGTIEFNGQRVERSTPYALARQGLAVVLEHGVIGRLSVHENLILGAYRPDARPYINKSLDEAFALFPVLAERRQQAAGSLSGGEQQMLCIARALMGKPSVLALDEPSVGLSPVMVLTIFKALKELNRNGLTILLVEQNVVQSLNVVSRAYVLDGGRMTLNASSVELLNNPLVRQAYLGL
jgi:branched-chain amino acid transport system ATP-binding protein